MNNWKEHAHLFANGKFQIKQSKFDWNKTHIINSYDSGLECFESDTIGLINISYCTLIARKIEDMTDEEIENYFGSGHGNRDSDISMMETHAKTGNIYSEDFIYLLSIGVYPGPQSHFGRTVIDINSL